MGLRVPDVCTFGPLDSTRLRFPDFGPLLVPGFCFLRLPAYPFVPSHKIRPTARPQTRRTHLHACFRKRRTGQFRTVPPPMDRRTFVYTISNHTRQRAFPSYIVWLSGGTQLPSFSHFSAPRKSRYPDPEYQPRQSSARNPDRGFREKGVSHCKRQVELPDGRRSLKELPIDNLPKTPSHSAAT